LRREPCTKVVDLAQRRYEKNQEEVWNELVSAIAALKDAERHLLKAHIAMEGAKWTSDRVGAIRMWALACENITNSSRGFLRLVGDVLGYDDPFEVSSE
jgi:hypothetical protein